MRVAAIQMTSTHEIEANLEEAGRHLAEAARLGAVLVDGWGAAPGVGSE